MGGWAIIVGVLVLGTWYATDVWTRAGKPPPVSLRCTNCPKLQAQVRWLYVVVLLLTLGWGATFVWALSR